MHTDLSSYFSVFSQTTMSTSDNHSHKEEKRGPSSIKRSVMENEEEKREPGTSSIDQLATEISELSIKVMLEQIILYIFLFLVNYIEHVT